VEAKEVRITCPCCQARLDVDVRTEKVVRWRAERGDEEPSAGSEGTAGKDFDTLARRVAGRTGSALDKFDDNLEREKRRGKDLDDLFRRANEKLKQGDEEE
jgi:hypothetical protein